MSLLSKLLNNKGARERPLPPQTSRFADVVRGLAAPMLVGSLAYKERAVWEKRGSVPDLQRFADRFLKDLQAREFPLIIVEAWRDGVRQQELFDAGFSRARPGQSAHNHGMAVDVIHWKRGWNLGQDEWAVIGAIGHDAARKCKLKVKWGGDDLQRQAPAIYDLLGIGNGNPMTVDGFRWDPAHWELADWRERIGK